MSQQILWFDENLDKLLRVWQQQIRINRNSHRSEARKLKKRFYIIGGGGTILGAIVTAVGLTFSQDPNIWVSIAQNIAIGIVTSLTGLVTFLGDDGNSSKHYEASNRYQALDFLISNILVIPKDQRDDAIEVLNSIRGQFDDISSSSPMLPANPTELQWTHQQPSPRVPSPGETDSSSDKISIDDDTIHAIPIDLDAHPTSVTAMLTTQTRMQNELCGIANRNNRYGVLDQMQYQLERMHKEGD